MVTVDAIAGHLQVVPNGFIHLSLRGDRSMWLPQRGVEGSPQSSTKWIGFLEGSSTKSWNNKHINMQLHKNIGQYGKSMEIIVDHGNRRSF